jgi:hypothetical protein
MGAEGDQIIGLARRAVEDREVMPGIEQAPRHRMAHGAKS